MPPRAKEGLDADTSISFWCCGSVENVDWTTAEEDDVAGAAQQQPLPPPAREEEQEEHHHSLPAAALEAAAGTEQQHYEHSYYSVEPEEEGVEIRQRSVEEVRHELLDAVLRIASYQDFLVLMNECEHTLLPELIEISLTSRWMAWTLQWISDTCAIDPIRCRALQSQRIMELLTSLLTTSGPAQQEGAARVIQTLTNNPDMDSYFVTEPSCHNLLNALAALAQGTLPGGGRQPEVHHQLSSLRIRQDDCLGTTSPVATGLQPRRHDTQECLGWILSPSAASSHGEEQPPLPHRNSRAASILLLSPPRTTRTYTPPNDDNDTDKPATPTSAQEAQLHKDWFFYYSPPPAAAAIATTTTTTAPLQPPSITELSPPPATINILSPPHGRGVQWPDPPHWPTAVTASSANDQRPTLQDQPFLPPQLPVWMMEAQEEEEGQHGTPLPPIWHSTIAPTQEFSTTPAFPELSPPRPLLQPSVHATCPFPQDGDNTLMLPQQQQQPLSRPWLFPRQQSWTSPVTRQARIHAMVAIRNLSSGSDHNKSVLGTWTPILECCKTLLQESSGVALRQHAAIALRNLSQLDSNHAAFVSFPGFIHTLGQAVRSSCDGNMDNDDEVSIQACWALTHLSTAKESKAQIYRSPGVMQALMMALHSSSKELVIRACSVLSNLAIGYDNKWNMYYYPGLLPAILEILSRAQHASSTDHPRGDNAELLSKACSILWSLSAEKQVQIPMVQEQPHVVLTLIRIVGHHTAGAARSKCWAALCLLAESPPNVKSLISSGIVRPLLEELQRQPDVPAADDLACSSWCVSCLMNLAQVDEAASILRHAGAVKLLEPMVVISSSTKDGSSLDYASLKAAMAAALICKTDNLHDKAILMDNHYHLLRKMEATLLAMTTVLYNTLAGRGGPGYKYGVFSLPCVVACMAALTTGPAFWQEHVCASTPLQTQLLQVLWDFAVHPVEGTALVGGGPNDEASAKSAVQALHAMVMYQYEHACLADDLRAPLLRALQCTERRLSSSKQDRNRSKDILALSARTRQVLQGFGAHLNGPCQQVQDRDGNTKESTAADTDGQQESHTVTPHNRIVARAVPMTPYNTKKRPANDMTPSNNDDHVLHKSPTCVMAVGLDSSATATPKKGRQNCVNGRQIPDNA